METPFLGYWITQPIIQVVCWTLIHSLWIGLLTSGLAGGIMHWTHKAPSALRYQLLCGSLLVFALLTGGILGWELANLPAGQSISKPPFGSAIRPSILMFSGPSARTNLTWWSGFTSFIDQHAFWIFAIWLLFFMAKSLRLVSGLYAVQQIRASKLAIPRDDWPTKVTGFSRRLNIPQAVGLFQSARVRVPVTVGFFKPIILLPVGLLCQLPPEQIEAILWHELAHIQRRDYLVNLLQNIAEAVFFFNPGLLWLSALIREQREICCDDLVLAHTPSKRPYVDVLLAFGAIPQPSLMVLGLGNHPFVNRVQRIVTQENNRSSGTEAIGALSGLVLSFLFLWMVSFGRHPSQYVVATQMKAPKTSLSVAASTKKTAPSKASVPKTNSRSDTLPIPHQPPAFQQEPIRAFTSIIFVNSNQDRANCDMSVQDRQGNLYRLQVRSGQLSALFINDKAVPEADLNHYQSLLHQINQVLADKQRLKQEALVVASPRPYHKTKPFLNQWPAETDGSQRTPGEDTKSRAIAEAQKKVVDSDESTSQSQVIHPKVMPPLPDISADQQRVRGVIAALVQHQVVANASAVDWFGLSETELIVNGVKQGSELHQKLKNQYGIKAQYGLYYGPVQMVGTGVFLDRTDL